MIRATAADRPAVEAFLREHVASSMFPLGNLRDHGMAGGHPRAVTCWLRWQAGRITDVLTLSDEGMVFPQCPTSPWGEVAVILAGQAIKGVLGEAGQVAAVRRAIGLTARPGLDVVEPHYHLPLVDLVMPDVAGLALRPLQSAPRALVEGWRAAYGVESLALPSEDAAAQATRDIATYLAKDSHRLLICDGVPVAMTGFNAVLPPYVQIGGVYTPPENRSRGLARAAVALHLAEARGGGATDAFLSAANAPAARAYEAIGFKRIGSYAIAIYEDPQVIHG